MDFFIKGEEFGKGLEFQKSYVGVTNFRPQGVFAPQNRTLSARGLRTDQSPIF